MNWGMRNVEERIRLFAHISFELTLTTILILIQMTIIIIIIINNRVVGAIFIGG